MVFGKFPDNLGFLFWLKFVVFVVFWASYLTLLYNCALIIGNQNKLISQNRTKTTQIEGRFAMKKMIAVFVVILALVASAVFAGNPTFVRNVSDIVRAERMWMPAGTDSNSPVSFYLYNDTKVTLFLNVSDPSCSIPIGVGSGGVARVVITPTAEEKIQPWYHVGSWRAEIGENYYLKLNVLAETKATATSRVLFLTNPVPWPDAGDPSTGVVLEDCGGGQGWGYVIHPVCTRLADSGFEIVPVHMERLKPFTGRALKVTQLLRVGYLLLDSDRWATLYNDATGVDFSVGRTEKCNEGEWEWVPVEAKGRNFLLRKGVYVVKYDGVWGITLW